MSFKPQPIGFATKAIHGGQDPEQWLDRAVVPPIVTSCTFQQTEPGQKGSFWYGRAGNPTRNSLEACLAQLDGGRHALAYASGCGAGTAVTQLLRTGDHVLCAEDVYGGTYNILAEVASAQGIHTDFLDMTDLVAFERALRPETRLVWIESPTNPLLRVVDIERVAAMLAKRESKTYLVVDNTYLTSYLQRPLELGADLVMYSLSKYMNGHSDVIMGALVTSDDGLHDRLRHLQELTGIIPSPFDCHQVNRSLKTLALRMDRHASSALRVAQFLEKHDRVERVLHPALPSHPQHELALRQQHGHSGTFAFYVRGGQAETVRFLSALRTIVLAASFGGYHSLIGQPIRTLYGPTSKQNPGANGVTENMLRLSVGLEDVETLIADLDQALNQI